MNRTFYIGFLRALTSIVILMAGPITAQTNVYDPLRVPELPNP